MYKEEFCANPLSILVDVEWNIVTFGDINMYS